jgi:triosephosphate isomerase
MQVVAAEPIAAIGTLAAVDRSQLDDHNRIIGYAAETIALTCGKAATTRPPGSAPGRISAGR